MNKYTGEVEVKIGNKLCKLVFDWRCLAEIQTKYGVDILKELSHGISFDIVADVLAIGLKKHNPEMTKDAILDESPAFVSMVKAIDKALAFAYFGADELPEKYSEEKSDVKKKTP